MSDIFVSYKHAQKQKARQLASALAACGWTAWWDWNIPIGNDWHAELDSELEAAGCVVVLWSAESIQSEWVLYEARAAQRAGKLIQALLETLQPPAEFASSQAGDLIGWEYGAPFHAGFDRLRAAIQELLDRCAPLDTSICGSVQRTSGEAGDTLDRVTPATLASRRRPAPVMLLPPPFRDLLDRRDESEEIMATVAERRNVALVGKTGSGKSALLSHVGSLDHTATFHDGLVYLQAATLGENDLAQALHEAFYDVPPGLRPSEVQMRRNLANKSALLLIDDVSLPPAALSTINTYGPRSTWIFASDQVLAGAQRRLVALKGLPAEEGIALFERTLSRRLRADELTIVAHIVESAQGHPARIEQAAGVAAMRDVAAAAAVFVQTPNLDNEDERSRRVLAAVACGGEVPLEVEQCAAIAGVEDVPTVLANLMRRGLVQHAAPGFRLAAGLAAEVGATTEFAACRDRATAVFTEFSFVARGTPRRVARLAAPMTASMAWAAQNGRSNEALRLGRTIDRALADSNRWDAWRDMLTRAHDIAVRAGDTSTASWALHQQGTRSALLGDKREARRLLNEARSIRARSGDAAGLHATSTNLKFLGWARWLVMLILLAGLGGTTLAGIAIAPWILPKRLATSPDRIDFGAQDIRATPGQQAIRIDNMGLVAFDVIDVTVQGPGATSYTVSPSCDGVSIARRSDCQTVVHFKPKAAGVLSATVAIRVRDVDEPYLVLVNGLATTAPSARLSAQAVDFGEVEIAGGAQTRSVTLSNTGSAPLTVTDAAISGDSDFRVVRENCKATVAPDAQCVIDLRFSPREAIAKSGQLVIKDNADGSPRVVALSGIGHATPKLEVTPASLAFGQQEIQTQSAWRSVRLRSAGTAPIDIGQVNLEGSNAFNVQSNCTNAKLAPDASCILQLRFAPSAIEASSGRLLITNSASSPRIIELSGTGFGRPLISIAPGQLDFGVFKRGSGVKPRRVTISSTGTAALLLRPLRIEGDARFSLINSCPEQLAPRSQCSVDIGFDPSGTGKASARLIAPHNAAGGSAAVALSAAIEALPRPVIESFEALPPRLTGRGTVQLCFRVVNAQRLTIEPEGSQPQSTSRGCVTRVVGATTTFRLTARGEGSPSQQESTTLTVTVATTPVPQPATPMIVDFRADPPRLTGPGPTRLCFAARNAERLVLQPGGPQPTSPSDGCVTRQVSATTSFTLTAIRTGASPHQRTLTVQVIPIGKPPTTTSPPATPPTKPTPTTPRPSIPKDEKAKVGSVIVKDAVKVPSSAIGAAELVGWCCQQSGVVRARKSQCTAPGQVWSATEEPAKRACAPSIVK